jgi:signal transduction histidine kinase
MPENLSQTVLGRYEQLIQLQQELSAILNFDQLVRQITHAAIKLCQAEHAVIFLADQTTHSLQYKSSTLEVSDEYRQFSIPIEGSLEGWVFTNQKVGVINYSTSYEDGIGKITRLDDLQITSIMCLPLIAKGTTMGVLEVINKLDGIFTALDQEVLLSFANQVAIYIMNTQMFVQSDLVSELVHELRTPLVSLNMAIHLLQRPDLPDEKRGRIFEMINKEFNRLSDMTTSFLEYARLESGRTKFHPTHFDIRQLLEECVDVMEFQAVARGITISLEATPGLMMLFADKDKVKQVVLNLLNNAIKYNHPGGNVTIAALQTPVDMTIIVNDSGQGIPTEYMPRLFTRFFRAPNQENITAGTGLGLSICKQIVEAHRGRLDVTSEVDKGSTFTVHLPTIRDDVFTPVE